MIISEARVVLDRATVETLIIGHCAKKLVGAAPPMIQRFPAPFALVYPPSPIHKINASLSAGSNYSSFYSINLGSLFSSLSFFQVHPRVISFTIPDSLVSLIPQEPTKAPLVSHFELA